MNKLVMQVQELGVIQSDEDEPVAVLYRGEWKRTESVLNRWRICQEWWKRPVERDYFRVRLEGGIICELFRERSSGNWQLQRVYD